MNFSIASLNHDNNYVSFSMAAREKLKKIMEERDLRPVDIARLVDRTPGFVNQWLSGHRNIGVKSALLLARALRLPDNYFMSEDMKLLSHQENEREIYILNDFRRLRDEDKEEFINFLNYLKSTRPPKPEEPSKRKKLKVVKENN